MINHDERLAMKSINPLANPNYRFRGQCHPKKSNKTAINLAQSGNTKHVHCKNIPRSGLISAQKKENLLPAKIFQ